MNRGNSLIHRNRFFPKGKKRLDGEEEEDLMEQGMADIPEAAGPSDRMNSRTGIVSPQAVRPSSDSGYSNTAGAAGPSLEERMRLQHPSQTEDFEMRDIAHSRI